MEDAAEVNVDLTFDSSEGRRPGSGSSWKGLGKVVRPVTGEGRDELPADVGTVVSTVRLSEPGMLAN